MGAVSGVHFGFRKKRPEIVSQHIVTIGWMIKYPDLPTCPPGRVNLVNLAEGEAIGQIDT